MLFIGIALLIAIGLTLVISVDAGSLLGLSQNETGQIIALILVLILVAGGAFGRRIKFSQMIISILLWAGIFAIAIIAYVFREDIGKFAGRISGELAPGSATIISEGEGAQFYRSLNGSFKLSALVNNVKINMIFDTGASVVVLTHDDALKLGINTDNLNYNIRVQTANGISFAAPIVIKNIKIGNIERQNIRAFVAQDGLLATSLLGMSFLETLSSYSVMNDRLELRD